MQNRKKKGFTLVELVIVIAVIAVLAAVLIPVFGNVINTAKVSKTKANLRTASNTLIVYAMNNDIEYYTPLDIKEYLKTQGIDTSEPVIDGYSIWYDQKTFNLHMIKNDELGDFLNGATASDADMLAYADVGENVVDTLCRRPEAITREKNLLLLATDEDNHRIIDFIEEMYTAFDEDSASTSGAYTINTFDNYKQDILLFFNGAISVSDMEEYQEAFNPETTMYIGSDGNFYSASSTGVIKNVVCSPNVGEVKGDLFNENRQSATGLTISLECPVEIVSKNDVVATATFLNAINKNEAVNIVWACNVDVQATVGESTVVMTSVKTAAGSVSMISSSVNSATAGGSVTRPSYKPIDTAVASAITTSNYGFCTVATGGATTTGGVTSFDFPATGDAAYVKYAVPVMGVDLATIRNHYGIAKFYTVEFNKVCYGEYYGYSVTATYYKNKTDGSGEADESQLYGLKLNASIGYITDAYYYYTPAKGEYNGEDSNIVYYSNADANLEFKANNVRVKLPVGSSSVGFADGEIEVVLEYQFETTYYKEQESTLGAKYLEAIAGATQYSTQTQTTLQYANGLWSSDITVQKVGDCAEADYYSTEVYLNRIIIKKPGEDGAILFAKYYNNYQSAYTGTDN